MEAAEKESFTRAEDSSVSNTAASSVTPLNSSKRKTMQQNIESSWHNQGEQCNVQVVVKVIFVALVVLEMLNVVSVTK